MRIEQDKIKLADRMKNALKRKEKQPYKLCIYCVSFQRVKNAYLLVIVNDIALSAWVALLAFIVTFNIVYALPGIIFFFYSSFRYIVWRVSNKKFNQQTLIYLIARSVFYFLVVVPYLRILIEVLRILLVGKKVDESSLTQDEQDWLGLVAFNRIVLLFLLMALLLFYFLFNIFWSYSLYKVVKEEIVEREKWKKDKFAKASTLNEVRNIPRDRRLSTPVYTEISESDN